ncbi:MAG: UDP-N-acetylmuramoyl-tripeptide--D-alanyl-D-alanine ligase [Lachnospiraceae bacterium]|uniref:UDP-N-acetylmuramoyl-tripeptide--D-alanyl-D-alanine ligase n=1 Tax=Hominisplanchenecus murintestinalis TaxID=2941517 RepID=A0AC61R0Q9_9FIRM|nr:UDP-N-acetylmuramoyl-tripeptide--D-alanyl-D-alanine ligase [Hominisplanchenecus murintestinalis]MCI9515498.1 UDP-N-acetylmuramoyl-tripeptide--D-alanyl-D-alanine ligase [Lachnospiraceae bacterium]MCI9660329.1 UDP-N-acetylmuramoyl-tripeptide--D-alanyl-D-alanine ligase [Lachnospiraceae bacterium]TGX99674.1 UDP-N-acetylmuramoyl-tripeptide--D-alanyl-D-alanine ligase [Hominisplanchenecus murintestinalis]
MKNMTPCRIAEVCGGIYHGTKETGIREIESITTDSRQAAEGCLFVAVKGERVDGHDFIPSVFEKGAACVVCEREPEHPSGSWIQVKSSLQAIKDMAEFYRKQLDIQVVGITGSVGKTSTKEVIASVLSEKYRVLKTLGNFNNELGLPLTVFRLREEHQIAVLEMGISDFGEMHRLSKIARPDVCVITNIGQCHLEYLKDRDGVLRAKSEIFDFMQPEGRIVLNGDDDKLSAVQEVKGVNPLFFGVESGREIYADEIEPRGLKGIRCRIHAGEESFGVQIPIPGFHMVLNALAATAVGISMGLTTEQVKSGIEKLQSLGGRFHMIEKGDMLIIDDCYNANPVSMKASLDVLKDAERRTVAVLGDMFELGENEASLHREVGVYAGEKGINLLICTGELSSHMAEAAIRAGGCETVVHVPNLERLMEVLPRLVQGDDTILVKASHGMHFEKVVELLSEL